MTSFPFPTFPLTRTASNVQTFVLTVLPHGGQRSARQNAWASMSEDGVRARARNEAESAMDRAVAMAQHPTATAL